MTVSGDNADRPAWPRQPSGSLAVGAIPREPPGFQPRPDLLVRRRRRIRHLPRVVGVAGVGDVVSGDLDRRLLDGERGPTGIESAD